MISSRTISWEALAWQGTERCTIALKDGRYIVDSTLNGSVEGQDFDLRYRLEIDARWCVLSVHIDSLPGKHTLVDLHTDAQGNWLDAQSNVLPAFSGCTDVDISLSPFTNTLPIRRLDFTGQPKQPITVVYIELPTGHLKPVRQWYTKLDDQTYKYEDENDYTNIITVDQDGLVVDYPELFRREN